jgi:hypothetical protein
MFFLQLLFNDSVYTEPIHRALLQVLRMSGHKDFICSGGKFQINYIISIRKCSRVA